MKVKSIVFITLVPLLHGCGGTYKLDPGDRPTARVRMISGIALDSEAALVTRSCASYDNWMIFSRTMASLPGRGSQPKRESIGIPLTTIPPDMSYTEQRVLANEPVNLGFHTTITGGEVGARVRQTCAVAIQFTPSAGEDYELLFLEGGQRCSVRLYKLVPTGAGRAVWGPIPNLKPLPRC